MARKGHIHVKKKVRKRKAEAPESEASGPAPSLPASDAQHSPLISPSKPIPHQQGGGPDAGIPAGLVRELERTTPWVILASIFQFFGALACLLVVVLAGVQAAGLQWIATGLPEATGGIQVGTLLAIVVGAVFLIGMLVFLMLGMRMVRFCQSVNRLHQSREPEELEFVLGYLRSIWQIIGALVMIFLVLGIVLFLVAR